MQQFNQFRTYAEGENMPITEDGISGVMARNSGVSMKGGGALRAAARKVQSAGRGEDKILVHINPSEYAELIRKHGPVIYNDETGLPQLGFFKSLGKILKIAAPIILSIALPGLGTTIGAGLLGAAGATTLATTAAASALGGAILGAGTNFVTSGGKLKSALIGGLTGGVGGALQGAAGFGGLSPDEYGKLTFAQKAMVGNKLGFLGATDPAKAVIANRAITGTMPGINFDPALAAKFAPAAAPPSFLESIVGKSPLTSSVLNPTMKGVAGLLTSPAGIMGAGYIIDALGKKKPVASAPGTGETINYPLAPGQTKLYSAVPGPDIVAPTVQRMAAVQQPTQQSETVQLPDGRIVPASYLQNGILPNYGSQQNVYNPFTFAASGGPVYARTGGLAQVKRYDEGGTVAPAPFVPTRRVLTSPELQAQGMDYSRFGETPRPVGMQSFFTPYTTAPITTTGPSTGGPGTGGPSTGGPGTGGPSTGGPSTGGPGTGVNDGYYVDDGNGNITFVPYYGGGTTPGGGGTTPGGGSTTPGGGSTTPGGGGTIPDDGGYYIDLADLGFGGVGRVYVPGNGGTVGPPQPPPMPVLPTTVQPTIVNPTIVQPTYQQQPTDQQEYFDQNYFNPYIGMQKGGALRQTSRYVRGQGDGQSDKIPAMLSDGEYVMDAESVSALGNGSSEAGAKKLDEFRMNLRKHKRSAPIGKIPPKTKKLNKYMSGGSR